MRSGVDEFFHLTYCTNVHPGNGWSEVLYNLQRYALALKGRYAPTREFGIGLRLSGKESQELLQGDALPQFRAFLQEQGLYVFTLNGFPYGPFHDQPVKAQVHAPDWLQEERVEYTLRLIEILAYVLPEGLEGSISTSPLTYKAWIDQEDAATWGYLTRNVVRIVEALVRLKNQQGKLIHLDLEPEPDGLLENSQEVVTFFQRWLLDGGAHMLAESLHISQAEAREHLLEHIRVCFDTCHVALAYEEPAEVLARFAAEGIKVGKVQISSALKVLFPQSEGSPQAVAQALEPFAESTYLHQVIQQNRDGSYLHYPDLTEALPAIEDPRIAQWRIHFHVPIFIDHYGTFLSTQDTIVRTLELLQEQRFCDHLEIETYTWGVLPPALKKELTDSIALEYAWVLEHLS